MRINNLLAILLYKLVTSFLIYSASCLSPKEICKELSEFLPNLCSYKEASRICKNICRNDSTGNQQENTLKCGLPSKQRFRRIISGNKSKPNQWPWHISLRLHDEHYCGGTILSEHFILTAAHCIDPRFTQTTNTEDFKVIAGLYYRDEYNTTYQQINKVRRMYIHPKYNLQQHDRKDLFFIVVENDIAIIELETPLQLTNGNTQSICLPDNNNLIPDNYQCYIIGWGQMVFQDNTSIPNELRFAEIETTPIRTCNEEKAFNNTVSANNSICGKGENFTISPCNKDSGGGMACLKDERWYVNGVISSGFKCGDKDAYSLYTNLKTFKPWIINILFKYATPTLEPPHSISSQRLMGTQSLLLFVVLLAYILFKLNITC